MKLFNAAILGVVIAKKGKNKHGRDLMVPPTATEVETMFGYEEQDGTLGCFSSCGNAGGSCPSVCGEGGYCCSGVNHVAGNGPQGNGDCPQAAIDAIMDNGHSCAVPTPNNCYEDVPARMLKGHAYTDSSNSASTCAESCAAMGFQYAGVKWGNICHCGNDDPAGFTTKNETTDCSMECSVGNGETCGGIWRLQLWDTGATADPNALTCDSVITHDHILSELQFGIYRALRVSKNQIIRAPSSRKGSGPTSARRTKRRNLFSSWLNEIVDIFYADMNAHSCVSDNIAAMTALDTCAIGTNGIENFCDTMETIMDAAYSGCTEHKLGRSAACVKRGSPGVRTCDAEKLRIKRCNRLMNIKSRITNGVNIYHELPHTTV